MSSPDFLDVLEELSTDFVGRAVSGLPLFGPTS
jgi:hypothetical protein